MTPRALFRYRNNCCLVCGLQQETQVLWPVLALERKLWSFLTSTVFLNTNANAPAYLWTAQAQTSQRYTAHSCPLFEFSDMLHMRNLSCQRYLKLHITCLHQWFCFSPCFCLWNQYGWPEHWQFSTEVSPHSYSKCHSKVYVLLITWSTKVVLNISCMGVTVCVYLKVQVKEKFTLEEVTKAQRVSIGIALFFL